MPTASRARVISPLVGEAMAQEAVELRIEEFREKGEEIPTGKDSWSIPSRSPSEQSHHQRDCDHLRSHARRIRDQRDPDAKPAEEREVERHGV